MKRHLYEICERYDRCSWWDVHELPYMPKVLAEKTAKQLNRNSQREARKARAKFHDKFRTFSTNITTKDYSPKGYKDWYEFHHRDSERRNANVFYKL